MSTGITILLSGLLAGAMCVTALAAANLPNSHWNYFHFDGRGFIAGQSTGGMPFVAVRDGVRPVVLTPGAKIEAVDLAAGTGAIVGICYIQSSGGKLKPGVPYLPCTRMPVQFFSGDKLMAATETDDQGYFQAVLATGRYRVRSKEEIEVTVGNGVTTLVPLRAGKRMVD